MKKYNYRKANVEVINSISILATTRTSDTCVPEHRVTHRTGDKMLYIPNDVALLMDAEKIRKFNPEAVQSVLSDYANAPTSLSQALRGIPDEKIIETIKSRYVQSTTDIHNFNRWLKYNLDDELHKIAKTHEDARNAADAAKQKAAEGAKGE